MMKNHILYSPDQRLKTRCIHRLAVLSKNMHSPTYHFEPVEIVTTTRALTQKKTNFGSTLARLCGNIRENKLSVDMLDDHVVSTWHIVNLNFSMLLHKFDALRNPPFTTSKTMAAVTFSLSTCPRQAATLIPRSDYLIAGVRSARGDRWVRGVSVRAIMGGNGRQERVKPGPGQESVWDYPRPPALQPVAERVRIEFNSKTIADSTRAYRVLETSHPPVYYIPKEDTKMEFLRRVPGSSFCEWKGDATYWTVEVEGRAAEKVGWSYESPTAPFRAIQGHLAFYCAPMDACFVGAERAQPQPGGFYGGWVTEKVVGPFKGGPGSWGW